MGRYLLMIFLLLCLELPLAGQPFSEDHFDHYTTATGLSHNWVTGIAQDSTGYIWAGTQSGLNRFNGSRFVQFHSNNDSLSLASEDIWNVTWLDKYRLAILNVGLHIIDTRTGATRNIFIPYHNRKFQFKFNMMARVRGDEDGNIYALTRSGFYHYDKDYKLVSRFDYYTEEQVPVTHFYFGNELLVIDKNRFLIASVGGLYEYDKRKKKLEMITAQDYPMLAEFIAYPKIACLFFQRKQGEIFVMKTQSDSIVYIDFNRNKKVASQLPLKPLRNEFHWRTQMKFINDTTAYITSHNSGFFKMRFDPPSGRIELHPEKYFPSYHCTTLFKDKDDNLWVATSTGLFRQNPRRSHVSTFHVPQDVVDSFPNIRLDDIYATRDKLYVASRGDGGLLSFDKKSRLLEKQILFRDFGLNYVRAIAPVDASTIMLGSHGVPTLFDTRTSREKKLLPPDWIVDGDWTCDLLTDSRNNIWIASHFIYKYNPASRQFKKIPYYEDLLDVPFVIQEDREGHIWMACHGIARYNTITEAYDRVLDSFPYIKMPDKQINAMAIDRQNNIWFNSNNNGLIAYNIDRKTYRHFTRNDGLPEDNIASLIVIGNQLWMAGVSGGIACMELDSYHIVSFGKEDGMPDMPVTKGARFYFDESDKQLYIAFATAVAAFDPHALLEKKSAPRIFIENLVLGDQNYFLPGNHITTSWKNNEVRIMIGTINFSDGNSQRFAYRIVKDSNSVWIPMGNQPSFSISSLSPGTHRIQVKVYSPNNRWPEQVHEMSLTVLPPLWKKDWFIIVILVLALLGVYLLIKWRTGLVRKKEMEKTHIEKLKADDYKNQFELEQISNYFSSSLTGKKTEDEVLWDVAQNLIGRMNYVDCMIYLWNEDKTKMIQKAAYGPKGKPEFISTQVFDVLPGQGIVGYVIQTKQPILVEDTRKDYRYRVDEKFRLSEICVPIIHNDELLGIIDSEHHQTGYFSERDIKILTTIATLIGNKLKQLESEQSLDAKRIELLNINEQLAEARLSALQAQMNPHFVFNALNSIKRMILDEDNEKASRYLSKFALMIRMTLDHSKEVFVTLDENIRYLETYLGMERLRFDDSFSYTIEVGENLDTAEVTIPSMMIQPLVENAIWHGLMQADHEKKILISFTQDDNTITCTVEDNGIGIRRSEKQKEKTRSPHQSVGLENLHKRIKIINEKYDMDCSLEILDLSEIGRSGTKVILQFNMVNA